MISLKQYSSIIVTGSIAFDDIMIFPGFFKDHFNPEKFHQINISFVVKSLDKHMGGTATNIAYNLTRITKKRVIICGGIGKDHKQLTSFYKKSGMDISGLYIDQELYTATGKVITDQADNQIWGYYYGACEKGDKVDFTKFDENAFGIISANHPKAYFHAQNYFIKNKIPYLYDPGMALTFIDDKDLLTGIEHSTFLVGNDYEIAQILRRLKLKDSYFIKKGIGLCTTLGAAGVHYQDKDHDITVKGYPVTKLIDPTGAGDAWRGGFVASLIDGKTVKESLKTANALASFAVENNGTVNHKPKKSQISKRAKTL